MYFITSLSKYNSGNNLYYYLLQAEISSGHSLNITLQTKTSSNSDEHDFEQFKGTSFI